MAHMISLLPLDAELHVSALQAVYAATPGRYLLGIVQRVDQANAAAGAELIGVLDFRLHWPIEGAAYVGMLMVAGPFQRQGVATQAWSLLAPWLTATAKIDKARTGVEQFNHAGLKFWQQMGFHLTGESDRLRSGDALVRLLYLEQMLAA
jgi:RimJ/RimL family protein N-acetyltransferase